ncbi:MAG TPA: hypothetical protein ENN74_03195 [Firmicutes bacterium]|nr:hypothetical protein [Bacillota bacterium]
MNPKNTGIGRQPYGRWELYRKCCARLGVGGSDTTLEVGASDRRLSPRFTFRAYEGIRYYRYTLFLRDRLTLPGLDGFDLKAERFRGACPDRRPDVWVFANALMSAPLANIVDLAKVSNFKVVYGKYRDNGQFPNELKGILWKQEWLSLCGAGYVKVANMGVANVGKDSLALFIDEHKTERREIQKAANGFANESTKPSCGESEYEGVYQSALRYYGSVVDESSGRNARGDVREIKDPRKLLPGALNGLHFTWRHSVRVLLGNNA